MNKPESSILNHEGTRNMCESYVYVCIGYYNDIENYLDVHL